MSRKSLRIENLHVSVEGKSILRGVNLTINQGETHALMGPNGSGKSTLSYALMGHPNYEITDGTAFLGDINLLEIEPDERAKAGLFLAFQYPTSIPGVTMANFLRHAVTNVRMPDRKEGEDLISMRDFRKLAMLQPAFAILDETDSGLDIDAVRVVSEGVNRVAKAQGTGVLVITHYQRILNYIQPQFVHILYGGKIVENGGPELVTTLEREGYDWIRAKYPNEAQVEDELESTVLTS